MEVSYSSTLVRSAFAVITDIFSQATVLIAFSFTDLKEVLFIGGFEILVFVYIIGRGIETHLIRHRGNEILILLDRIVSKTNLYFYFITIRFMVDIVKDQI